MVEYSTVNAKLADSQLNKVKNRVKGTTLRMNVRMFNRNVLIEHLY